MKNLIVALSAVHATAVSVPASPVKKVVSLLQDMQEQMKKDMTNDEKAFKKMECWCKTHRGEKTAAAEEARKVIKEAKDTIKQKTGAIAGLNSEIKNLEKDTAAAVVDVKKATDLRNKERAETLETQKEMGSTVEALGGALDILGKVQKGFIQQPTAFIQIRQKLDPFRSTLRSDLWSVLGKLNSAESKTKFLQQSEEPEAAAAERDYSSGPVSPNAKNGGVAGITSYNSNSGAIFGLLDQMKVDFENQLADSKKSEAAKESAFKKLTAEKNKQIAFNKNSITAAKKDIGTAKIDLSNAETTLEETMMDLSATDRFLLKMEDQCKDAVDGYGERSTERAAEMKAVGEAVSFLTSDEARDIFNKAYGLSFVQLKSISKHKNLDFSSIKSRKIRNLVKSAKFVFSQLTTKSQLDAFVKVKEALNKLKGELEQEQKDEFNTRDECIEDMRVNEVETTDTATEKEDSEANVAELAGKLEEVVAEIEVVNAAIKQTTDQVAEAAEDRKAENAVYQETKNDQELTIKVLKVALSKLSGFYGNLGGDESTGAGGPKALLQQEPPKQASYDRQQGGSGAMGLLQVIIADADHVIKIATKDEQRSQADYEQMVADSKQVLENLTKKATSLGGQKGELTTKKESESEIAREAGDALLALGKEGSAIHGRCDFLLNNFDVRQSARLEEIESIEQAKQVLNGADFE